MGEKTVQENLKKILIELDRELQFLLSKQILTKIDVQKIRAQAEVSKDAMLTTRDETSFNDAAKEKLMNALIQDFEKSVQRTLDEAVSRKGDKDLVIYRLNRIDGKIYSGAIESSMSQAELDRLQVSMELLKAYILRSLPERGGFFSASKIDVSQITTNYEQVLLEYARERHGRPKLQG